MTEREKQIVKDYIVFVTSLRDSGTHFNFVDPAKHKELYALLHESVFDEDIRPIIKSIELLKHLDEKNV